MTPGDLARVASVGLRTCKLRASLSALGIAIGVAAIVAVLGLSRSSEAGLLAQIELLGTNVLTVTPGQSLTGQPAQLPATAPAMIARISGVAQVQDVGAVNNASVYRSPLIPAIDTNSVTVDAATLGLPRTAGTSIAQGSYLNAATAREPVTVLGADAAARLGINRVFPGMRIWLGGQWFYVTGIMRPALLDPGLDSAALVGFPAAERYLGFGGHPSTIYVRTQTSQINQVNRVQSLLAATADPEDPSAAAVSQPSAALIAQADAQSALNGLFLGLGAVALLVGAVGVANIMVISVVERRSEIGLRRALGATKGDIRIQFLTESILLAAAGGLAGVLAGAAATAIYAHAKGWVVVIPAQAWAGGIGAALLIGAAAGLLPALRAARMPPTQALWTI
ncbi:MAG: ABC transporter permease [Streptosporangiaceae bacterium]